ncbi:MAG TPA: DUF2789 domain-containing protein [Dongiaceae bacterium]|nr:DUF2789 domain-containing protein [Dongiaceae bacterium]
MDSGFNSMARLFKQLGLPSSPEKIDDFIGHHHCLTNEMSLDEAPFWNDSQAEFIRAALLEDSDWAETVDQLDVRLR